MTSEINIERWQLSDTIQSIKFDIKEIEEILDKFVSDSKKKIKSKLSDLKKHEDEYKSKYGIDFTINLPTLEDIDKKLEKRIKETNRKRKYRLEKAKKTPKKTKIVESDSSESD